MKIRPRPWLISLVALLPLLVARPSMAQIATVDASDTASGAQQDPTTAPPPEVSYDPEPYIYFPPIPDDITQIYYPWPPSDATAAAGVVSGFGTTVTNAASDGSISSSEQGAIQFGATFAAVWTAGVALAYPGIVTGPANYETAGYVAQQPQVITGDPDTHSLMTGDKAAVYYVEPAQPSGPHKKLTAPLKFDFGPALVPPEGGYTRVSDKTAYGPDTGFGWGDASKVTSGSNGMSGGALGTWCKMAHGRAGGKMDAATPSPTPFFVDLPNGRYLVTVAVAPSAAGQTTRLAVWANGAGEIARLQGNKAAGVSGSFEINVYNGRLMLEFFNALDSLETTDPNTWTYVSAVTIHPVDTSGRKRTIYVASDSTASAYAQSVYPMTGWGARLAYFLSDDVQVVNYAVPGASSKSFYERRWLKQIENKMLPGDYLFFMFAINDSADDDSKRKTSAGSTFKAYLRQYVAAADRCGALPVFVTSQTKRTYDTWGRFTNSVQGYPQAMRELAAELGLPLIDLNAMSIQYLDSIGVEASKDVYMFVDPGEYDGWPSGRADYIHLQDHGATMYAWLIMQAAREIDIPGLAPFVLDEPRY